ncbi:hypothetical protein AURDEDRAFT_182998 [Auricularia subglabra TFB-10046 SS5]|nr:hypothetical protein AURDEDRAFT_182998 [Auricularia subglabra TFB-10046 SS5]
MTDRSSCSQSTRAQALESASSALAEELLSGADSCHDVDAHFETMQTIVTRAFRAAAKKWNRAHDRLCALPMELRTICWSYLSPSEMLGLANVSTSWRDLSRGTPLLWTTLSLSGKRSDPDSILSLSARLPFDIEIWDCVFMDVRRVDESLRTHAARLKRLRITVTCYPDPEVTGTESLFCYPAPALHRFTLVTGNSEGDWHLSPDLFNGFAPNLRLVTLYNAVLPASCAAFSNVTRLKLQANCGPLGHIYTLVPRLEVIELEDTANLRSLAAIPPTSRLTKATFSLRTLWFATLLGLGYVRLPQLVVSVPQNMALILSVVRGCPPSFISTLSISDTGRIAVVLRQDTHHSATFITPDVQHMDVLAILRRGASFHTLQNLVLPGKLARSFSYNDAGSIYYPYILLAGLSVPTLRTLTILCGPHGMCSLLDPDVPCGVVKAPLLSRLELLRDPEAGDAGDPVDPCDLALFIERHLQCDKPGELEVYVDSAGGVRLECDHDPFDRDDDDEEEGIVLLRRRIGKLIVW